MFFEVPYTLQSFDQTEVRPFADRHSRELKKKESPKLSICKQLEGDVLDEFT